MALCRLLRSAAQHPVLSFGMILCRRHIIAVARSAVTRFGAQDGVVAHSCGNQCLASTRVPQTVENLKRLVVSLSLLLLLFLFLLPWYPWRSHEQRACFRWTAVPSPLLAACHNRGSPRNSPHTDEFCGVRASRRLRVFSSRVHAEQQRRGRWCVDAVCICVEGGQAGCVTDTALSLSGPFLPSCACSLTDVPQKWEKILEVVYHTLPSLCMSVPLIHLTGIHRQQICPVLSIKILHLFLIVQQHSNS